MLLIREEQLGALRRDAYARSEARLQAALRDAFPAQARRLGDAGTLEMVRLGIARAARHRVLGERAIFMFLDMMMMLGAYFDDDPQLPWVRAILGAGDPLAERLALAHDAAFEHRDSVAGQGDRHLVKALLRARSLDLAVFDDADDADGADDGAQIAATMARIFPQKARHQPPDAMRAIRALAHDTALVHGMVTRRDTGLVATLMFLLGHGFVQDPCHPWARAALAEEALAGAAGVGLHRAALAALGASLAPAPRPRA